MVQVTKLPPVEVRESTSHTKSGFEYQRNGKQIVDTEGNPVLNYQEALLHGEGSVSVIEHRRRTEG
jgi:hypothetical protein